LLTVAILNADRLALAYNTRPWCFGWDEVILCGILAGAGRGGLSKTAHDFVLR
jgi:hypothetical protein